MPGREKAADEVFCRSCGEAISQSAELCPHCGVRNAAYRPPERGESLREGSAPAGERSGYETDVSADWWKGVVLSVVLWVLALSLTGATGGVPSSVGGFLVFVAWAGLPLSAYFDMQYVRANGEWDPETAVWVVLLSVWFVNIPAGVIYLYRRRDVLGVP
jgi:hypothetical protein